MRARAAILVTLMTFMIPWTAQAQQSPDTTQTAPEPAVMTPPPVPVTQTEPDFPRGRISGYMFGDAYYNVAGDPVHTYVGSADLGKPNIDGAPNIGKDLNGFQVRRVYFQLDNDLSVKFATRFRLEMDGKELTSGGKLGVFVKNAYLQAKNVVPRGNFFFGEINTPTFENSEEFWQYRSIEKTIADFRGIASSSDLGVELKGYADGGHKVGYSAMIGDGQGQKPETNRYKRMYLSVPLNPVRDFKIEPYVDYEWGVAGADKALYKVFAGYEFKKAAIGGEAVDQVAHSRVLPNTEARGFSVFARAMPSPTLGAFVRADRWQPNTRLDNRIDQDLLIGGIDWQPYKDVHIMPNVESLQYRAKGTAVAPAHHDTQARITFYYKFSKP
jgi:hypothetical protein